MADNIRQDNLTLPFGGVSVKGQLTTNLDNGEVQWRPYNGLLVSQDVYLESTYDENTNKWKWTPVGDVFNDVRNFNSSVGSQYSTSDSVAQEFYTNTYKIVDKTIDTNWDTYGVELTAERNNWNRGSGNTASTPDQPSTSDSGQQEQQQQDLGTFEELSTITTNTIEGIETRSEYDNYYYPNDIGDIASDVIKFTMLEYESKNLEFEDNLLQFGSRKFETQKGSVTIAIQPSISDYNSVTWNPSEMNPIYQAAGASSLSFMEGGFEGLEDSLKKIVKGVKAEGPNVPNAILKLLAQEATGAKGLLTRLSGAVLNPNLELLFQGPSLRQFTFNFKMSPRDDKEASQVRQIIRYFKQGSAVQRSTAYLFLKTPHVFKIEYLYRKKDGDGKISINPHKSLNRIKTCALTSVSVNYTPFGSYMTYEEDGSMISYELTLTFNELEPIYEDEYDRNDNDSIEPLVE